MLRIRHCHCMGLGRCCSRRSIPVLENFRCSGHRQKKKNRCQGLFCIILYVNSCHFHYSLQSRHSHCPQGTTEETVAKKARNVSKIKQVFRGKTTCEFRQSKFRVSSQPPSQKKAGILCRGKLVFLA